MRFRITPDDLEKGETLVSVGKKKIDQFMSIVASRSPVTLIAPVIKDGRQCRIIIPTEVGATETRRHRLKFRPVWAKCFKVCHLRSTQIRALVCDFGKGQLLFDENGERPCNYSLQGEGVDPDLVRDADTELANLMDKNGDNYAVKSVVAYLKRQAA